MKIFFGIRHRLADIGVRREVHDGIGSRQHSRQRGGIQHVALDQFKARRQRFIAGAKIVENDDFMPGALQRPGRVTADVSRTTDDQNDHVNSLSTGAMRSDQISRVAPTHGCNNMHIATSHQMLVPNGNYTGSLVALVHQRSQERSKDRSKPASNLLYKPHPMT